MEKTDQTDGEQQTSAPAITVVAPTVPSHGGSYTLDDATGEHTLIERTQPKEQP